MDGAGLRSHSDSRHRRAVGWCADGALIERDSNGNGEYVRFADGLQICTYDYTATADARETTAGALYCMSSSVTWTYPAAFVATPVVVASVKRGTNFPSGVQIVGSTATTADLKPWTAISAATSTGEIAQCLAVEGGSDVP